MTLAFPRFSHAARGVGEQTDRGRSSGDDWPVQVRVYRGRWGGSLARRINIHPVTPSLVLFALLALIRGLPPRVGSTSEIHRFSSI